MSFAITSAIARGATVLTLIFLVLAIIKKSLFVAGVLLLVFLKLIIVIAFVTLLISIICAIVRDRRSYRGESQNL